MGENRAIEADTASGLKTLHAVSVLDGMLAICAAPGWRGNYQADLDDIHVWRPGLVASMTTEAEQVEFGAPHLGSDIQSLGSRWFHLPVWRDTVPGPDTRALWPAASAQMRQALSGGGRVLMHCRRGCESSGMMALRLMIECGEAPEQALARLRALRPCAVHTGAQLQWAYTG